MVKRSFDDIFGCGSAKQPALFETPEVAAAVPTAPKSTSAATKTKKQKKQSQLKQQSNPSTPTQPFDDSSEKNPRKAAAAQRQDTTSTARKAAADQPSKLSKEPRARPAANNVTKLSKSSDIVTIKPSDTVSHEHGGIGQQTGEETAASHKVSNTDAFILVHVPRHGSLYPVPFVVCVRSGGVADVLRSPSFVVHAGRRLSSPEGRTTGQDDIRGQYSG